MGIPTPNLFPGAYPMKEAREKVVDELDRDTREADTLVHGVDILQFHHESLMQKIDELIDLQRRQVSIWQSPPKSTKRIVFPISTIQRPFTTEGYRFTNIFVPGLLPIQVIVEETAVKATLTLQPGWNSVFLTDQSMVSVSAGLLDLLVELNDIDNKSQPSPIINPNGVWIPGVGWAAWQAGNSNTDALGVLNALGKIAISEIDAGVNGLGSNANAFWNAAVLGAGVTSPAVSIGGVGKVRIFVSTSVADTFNVQISDDGGTTWYTLTQDNAGTPLIIATTATQLSSCRDIATFGSTSIRLLNVTAATVTAGYQTCTM